MLTVILAELFEGSTYTNKDNLPPDFIMKSRSCIPRTDACNGTLLGNWGAFEGLVYPQYNDPASSHDSENANL
jgi:hypothetical protein